RRGRRHERADRAPRRTAASARRAAHRTCGLGPRPGVLAGCAQDPGIAAPPAPIALMATICIFALVALTWSFFGRLDVHAVAPGKVETAGHSKVIEPLDPGKVAAIHVEAAQSVKAGDLLFELDPAEADADAAAAEDSLNASRAEIARRRFAIEAVRSAEGEEMRADVGQDNA